MSQFVHLHNHTEYSLLDGLSRIKKMILHVKENDMQAIAVTDHGAMYGIIEFYKEAKKQEIKPIVGLEAYTTNDDLSLKSVNVKTQNYHLTLLAKDYQGYKNLMELTSIAHTQGFYYKPRITKEILKKHSKGLICLSGCPQAEIPQLLINDEYQKAKDLASWFLDIFGDDFYLEIQRHFYEKVIPQISDAELKNSLTETKELSDKYADEIIKLSRDLGIPLVATNDNHYIKKEDALAQDALVCIATGKLVSDIKRLRYIDNPDFYIKSSQEMIDAFSDFPDAILNSVKIAGKCNLEIPLGKWAFPKFELPKNKDREKLTEEKYLEKLVWAKSAKKIANITAEVKKRLKYELEIIINKGYAPYFLIVMDMVNWASENGIVTNTRGSAAGSLVSYVLGITTVNPITYGLPFERFLNPYRPSPPDIDFDISDNRRDDVIEYITNKYGKEKTAQVCTFGRMLSRAAVRDIARVLGYPYSIGDKIAKVIPPGMQGFPMTFDRALRESAELKNLYESDSDCKKIVDLAKRIEGNARHVSVHAAGVVVAPTKLTDFSPIQMEPKGKKIITQYEMHACEDVGLIKFDVLGIRNLSILDGAIEIVKNYLNIKIDLNKIPIEGNDSSVKKTFEMLSRGETMGVFQLNGAGMTKFLKELKPARVEDLMAMVALYRPGPMAVIPEYIKRKNNPKLVKYLDPRMEKFLNKSYGLLVYQDDLLFCALELAGYTWEEADKFRKAVGKKIPEEMAAQHSKFVEGVIKNGQTKEFAENLWKLFEPFQSYGFNKAHAASYGMVAYYTAYMKANFPVEYMTALLTAESDDSEKIAQAIFECKRMGINILPPNVNESDLNFKIVDDQTSLNKRAIRFGLSAIKNVGDVAISDILEKREKNGKFRSFSDFVNRVDGRKVNKKVLESLIKAGAMEEFGKRVSLLAVADLIKSKLLKSRENNGQSGLFSDEDSSKTSLLVDDVVKIDDSLEEFSDREKENFERELLGFSISAKPVSEILSSVLFMASNKIGEIDKDAYVGKVVKIVAIIRSVKIILTKQGSNMAFIKVEDDSGTIEAVVFPKIFLESRNVLNEGNVVLLTGKIDTKNDEPNILAEKVEELRIEGLHTIKIPQNTTKDSLLKLKKLFDDNPGSDEVLLLFEKNSKTIKPKIKVLWSRKLQIEIENILGYNG